MPKFRTWRLTYDAACALWTEYNAIAYCQSCQEPGETYLQRYWDHVHPGFYTIANVRAQDVTGELAEWPPRARPGYRVMAGLQH